VNNKFSELTEEKTKLKEMLDKRIEEFWALTKEIASLRITFEG
jgi:predicted nuclease with TOPRIM domain